MDVDLLRPGTVPISPGTVLWFEFLLDKGLLERHLAKPIPDPSPVALIIKFTSVNLETNDVKPLEFEAGDTKVAVESDSKRTALKLLSLKVVAHMKWNLDFFLTLPFKVQTILMEDLMGLTSGKIDVDLYTVVKNVDISSCAPQFLFALTFYHRWVIKTVNQYTNSTHHPSGFGNGDVIPYTTAVSDDANLYSMENVKQSIQFLEDVLNWSNLPYFLSPNCFAIPQRKNEPQNWDQCATIGKEELCVQISYDIAVYFFYEENYQGATFYFRKCSTHMETLKPLTDFVVVERPLLDSYLFACSGAKDESNDLLQQMYSCIYNQYIGLLNVLQKDNDMGGVIPAYCRINLELDVYEAVLSGKFTVARDFLPKLQCLNVLRHILRQVPIYNFDLNSSNVDAFIWALLNSIGVYSGRNNNKQLIWNFISSQLLRLKGTGTDVIEKLLSNDTLNQSFDLRNQYALLLKSDELYNNQGLALNVTYDFSEIFHKGDPLLEKHLLEQAVVKCYEPEKLKQLLNNTSIVNANRQSLWKINSCWAISIPLQSVLAAMSKGQQQDLSYVLLIKSRELALMRNWTLSLHLLEMLKQEIMNASEKLTCLINFEILLIRINQFLEEWKSNSTASATAEQMELADECVKCLQAGGYILPRTEIMEQCILCLINLKHWDFLNGLEKRWTFNEIAIALASTCQCLQAQYTKGNKKFPRELWDLVLPIFLSSNNVSGKRSSSGNLTAMQRDAQNGNKTVLLSFFRSLREPTVLNIVISMLTRIYNILKDESNVDLSMENLALWPAVISNVASYNTKTVSEMLFQLLQSALTYHPTNVVWLRLLGDVNYGNGYFEKALKSYLTVLALSSDYFSAPIKTDDHMMKRALKCCFNLGCHTQTAVLAQFLDEPDYMQAFHSLSEQKFCNDANDAYYHCFWDTSILEYLIHVHHKRSEYQRRKKVVNVMGLLELNSNNNQEIHQESCNSRKRAFLRALCRYFLYFSH